MEEGKVMFQPGSKGNWHNICTWGCLGKVETNGNTGGTNQAQWDSRSETVDCQNKTGRKQMDQTKEERQYKHWDETNKIQGVRARETGRLDICNWTGLTTHRGCWGGHTEVRLRQTEHKWELRISTRALKLNIRTSIIPYRPNNAKHIIQNASWPQTNSKHWVKTQDHDSCMNNLPFWFLELAVWYSSNLMIFFII